MQNNCFIKMFPKSYRIIFNIILLHLFKLGKTIEYNDIMRLRNEINIFVDVCNRTNTNIRIQFHDPFDCNGYYACYNHKLVHFRCINEDYHFNPVRQSCVPLVESLCGGRSEEDETQTAEELQIQLQLRLQQRQQSPQEERRHPENQRDRGRSKSDNPSSQPQRFPNDIGIVNGFATSTERRNVAVTPTNLNLNGRQTANSESAASTGIFLNNDNPIVSEQWHDDDDDDSEYETSEEYEDEDEEDDDEDDNDEDEDEISSTTAATSTATITTKNDEETPTTATTRMTTSTMKSINSTETLLSNAKQEIPMLKLTLDTSTLFNAYCPLQDDDDQLITFCNPYDNRTYWACMNGTAHSIPCSQSLKFLWIDEYCSDAIRTSKCSSAGNALTDTQGEHIDCVNADKNTRFLFHPYYCNLFYQCNESNEALLKSCPKFLKWNRETRHCDWPQNVKCNSKQTASHGFAYKYIIDSFREHQRIILNY